MYYKTKSLVLYRNSWYNYIKPDAFIMTMFKSNFSTGHVFNNICKHLATVLSFWHFCKTPALFKFAKNKECKK